MKRKPSTEATAAWIRLMRVQSRVLDCVEQDLKKAGFPPLAWYDALLELSRAPSGEMRPVELEKQMLLPQYSTSRLIDRLVDEGLAARRECAIDKRGQFVGITEAGREVQEKKRGANARSTNAASSSKSPRRAGSCRKRCGARIRPRSKSMSARNCPMPMRR